MKRKIVLVLLLFVLLVAGQPEAPVCTEAINQLIINNRIDNTNMLSKMEMMQNQTITAIKASSLECRQYVNQSISESEARINQKIIQETLPTKFILAGIIIGMAVITGSRWLNARKKF